MEKFAIKEHYEIYAPSQIGAILDKIGDIPHCVDWKDRKKHILEIPCAFDIETTSFYYKDEKRAIMCEWTFGILNYVVVGRTWEQFVEMLEELQERLDLGENKKLLCYCHNLSYEFQFMRKWLEWLSVFSVDERKPVKALCSYGVEFRCSYILSGYSLDTVGKNLTRYKVKKLVGGWNYNLYRHPETPLTEEEIHYCINDVVVVMAYIQERIEIDGGINKIPFTKTGYVREYCKKACYEDKNPTRGARYQYYYYREKMRNMTLEREEFELLRHAFQGGFTHSNPLRTNKVQYNVKSVDETSAYPYAGVSEPEYPTSKGYPASIESVEQFELYLKKYCCVFEVYFEGLEPRFEYDSYISSSHCTLLSGETIVNGRVRKAHKLATVVTHIDFEIIRKCYKWDKMKVGKFYRYYKGYLPKEIIESILKFYADKTQLKGVEGKEVEYMAGKENVNSIYGMMATNPIRPIYEYGEEWGKTEPDIDKELEKYNKNPKRFSIYSWAVFLTAIARRNLWNGILECGEDYIYADTDSIKMVNYDMHREYFERYNNSCIDKMKVMCRTYKIPLEKCFPKTIRGIEKPLGVWDDDGFYNRFKTLGAKRYMVEHDNEINITVSGLDKKSAMPYLKSLGEPFEVFQDGLYIPPEYTGKMIHTYLDDEQTGYIEDYEGNKYLYHERSSIHLEGCEYHLGVMNEFLMLILNMQYIKGEC